MLRVGAVVACVALLVGGDRAAERLRANYDRGLIVGESDDQRSGPDPLFPAFREFLGGLRVARINAALHAGDPQRALRYAREALALVPDRAELRARVADVLAFDLPPVELEPARRVAWIAEALRVLDEGLQARPDSAFLHFRRGLILVLRGKQFAEFEDAWRSGAGRSTLDSGVEEFVRAAELAPFQRTYRFWAAVHLEERGTRALDLALANDPQAAVRAADDLRSSIEHWQSFLLGDDPAGPTARAMILFLEHVRDEATYLTGADLDPAHVAELERVREELDRARWDALGR